MSFFDLLLATSVVRAKWYKHFEKLIEEVEAKVRLKLSGARSISMMKMRRSKTETSFGYRPDEGLQKGGLLPAMLPKQVSQPRLVGDKLLKLREDFKIYGDARGKAQLPPIHKDGIVRR